jgi:hypothetical protein
LAGCRRYVVVDLDVRVMVFETFVSHQIAEPEVGTPFWVANLHLLAKRVEPD